MGIGDMVVENREGVRKRDKGREGECGRRVASMMYRPVKKFRAV